MKTITPDTFAKRSMAHSACFILLFSQLSWAIPSFSQVPGPPPKGQHQGAKPVFYSNEVFAGYNYGTLYLNNPYADHTYRGNIHTSLPQEDANTIGTFTAGYYRNFSEVIQYGIVASYSHLGYTGTYYTGNDRDHQPGAEINDQVISGITVLTINYLHRPVVRLYSAFGIGLTVVFSTIHGTSPSDGLRESKHQLNPAAQVTMIGIRVGRTIGGFAEIGVGTNAMLGGGVFYRFGN